MFLHYLIFIDSSFACYFIIVTISIFNKIITSLGRKMRARARAALCNVLLRLFYSIKLYLCTSLYTNCEIINISRFLVGYFILCLVVSRSLLRDKLN